MNKCIICGYNIETLQDENAVTYNGKDGFMCEKCFTKDTKKENIKIIPTFIIKCNEPISKEAYEVLVQEISEWTAENNLYLDDVIEEKE
jgi:hypothetical protein